MTRNLARGFVLLAVLALAVAACGDGGEVVTEGSTTTSGPATTTTVTAGTAPVLVYLVRDEHVGVVRRMVEPPALARGAVEALLAGPDPAAEALGFGTQIPTGVALRSLDLTDGLATIDLSADFESGGGSSSMQARVAQVVFTLTQFDTVDHVAFRLDGEPVTAIGGEGVLVDPPVTRTDFPDQTPQILVEEPAPGDTVASPMTVSGLGATFEGTVNLRLGAADGTVLAETFTTGEGANGVFGPFSVDVDFDAGDATTGTLRVFEISPRDGAEENVVEVPVTFAP